MANRTPAKNTSGTSLQAPVAALCIVNGTVYFGAAIAMSEAQTLPKGPTLH